MDPRLRAALTAAVLSASTASFAGAAMLKPPVTPIEVVRDTLHGVVVEDPYRWLEDKDSPRTREWVKDQMDYTQQMLGGIPGRDDVKAKLALLTKVESRTAPIVRGKRLFYTARTADQQQAVLVMREGAEGPDQVLIDPNPMGTDHTTSVALIGVSTDGKLIAFGLRKGGEDETDVRLMDVDTHAELPGGLPKARYFGVAIAPDKKGCWYSRWQAKGSRVWYHRFGDEPANDRMVFGDGLGPTQIPAANLSDDGRWLLVSVFVGSAGDDTQLFLQEVGHGDKFTPLSGDLHVRANADFAGDQLVIHTNWNAPNGRMMIADLRKPAATAWRELAPERRDAAIEGFSLVGGRIYVQYLHNVTSQILAYTPDGKAAGEVALPGLGSATAPSGEWTGHEGYFTYTSFNQPPVIERLDPATGLSKPWWHSPAPFDGERYDVHQFWYNSKDGTKVPMFVVQPKNMTYNGTHPVLMTGYGGFNVSETPAFSPLAAAWLELGGVYVLTNLRGGAEFGDAWHKAGMLANKQTTFDDFQHAAMWLITHGYCTPQKLGITGGSNGGLLMGASFTQRPDLFGAVVCQVPLLDMLRYQRFLVARFWVPEYGSSEDAEQFKWLQAYSPYQHVKAGTKYPGILFVSGDSDTRVDPSHARKMTALMQAAQGGDQPILLHYDLTLGHAGGKSVDKTIEDNADVLQFLRWQLGMTAVN